MQSRKGQRVLLLLLVSLAVSSCAKKPQELYDLGMKSYSAGDYSGALDYFKDGIRKDDSPNLYSGFIAADLVTGKYPEIISAYNNFSDGIHASLVRKFGTRTVSAYSIAKELIPYKTSGGNKLAPDFPGTIQLQIKADYQGYLTLKQQVDIVIKK